MGVGVGVGVQPPTNVAAMDVDMQMQIPPPTVPMQLAPSDIDDAWLQDLLGPFDPVFESGWGNEYQYRWN